MSLSIALDTVAVRLFELANDGRWEEAKQEGGPEEALAMFRTFLYADVAPWVPKTVGDQLRAHGNEAIVEATEALLAVRLLELPVQDGALVDELVAQWTGRVASASDARWLAEVAHVGFIDVAVTFDERLIRGVSGKIDGLSVCTPSSLWGTLEIPRGATPRMEPARGHPLYSIEDWRWS